ncbi:MAG: hypothetical protein M1839_004587 [Geoglossum umbratile]|nr:MAG: hypothetical protein M1839_004587 [Geoglossum umbratile]
MPPEVTAPPTILSDRPAQSTRPCRVIPSDEEIARALLKRASLQARTGAISAPIRRELEANAATLRDSLDPDLEMPFPALLQRAAAGRNTVLGLEQLKDAVARAILCAKRKAIRPPDWVWSVVRDFKVTIDPELYRFIQTPEEDRTDVGGAPSSPKAVVAPSFGREITSAEVGKDLGASESTEDGHAAIHEASVTDTLGRIGKQETIDTPMDFDPFAGLDTWLTARELANSKASESIGEGDSMEGIDFDIFSLALNDPATAQDHSRTNNISGPSDSGELKSNEHIDSLELDDPNGSNVASTRRRNAAAVGSREPQPVQTPQDFEPLFP